MRIGTQWDRYIEADMLLIWFDTLVQALPLPQIPALDHSRWLGDSFEEYRPMTMKCGHEVRVLVYVMTEPVRSRPNQQESLQGLRSKFYRSTFSRWLGGNSSKGEIGPCPGKNRNQPATSPPTFPPLPLSPSFSSFPNEKLLETWRLLEDEKDDARRR